MPELAGRVADAFESLVRENEERWLSLLAVRSYESRGRNLPEEECRLRTLFQRDRDRIVHAKAFRRLRHKTQVFVDPEGDHFRTRLTHTLETPGSRAASRGRCASTRTSSRRSASATTSGIRRSATPASRPSTSWCASAAAAASGTTSTRSAWSSDSSATDAG